MQTPISTSFNLPDGREVTIETGKLASLADGSAVVKMGNTMLFASAVSSRTAREGQSFFPLSVDYQEKFAAAGKIPGNFFRREAKLSDYEVLTSRLVDRAIRPLFPDGYMFETQIIINLISGEVETLPDAFVALAASAALTVSDIPFAGPISEVRVALIDGEYKVNPGRSELANAELDIIVGATMADVTMVEGEAKEVSEKTLVDAIKVGHDAIKVQIQAQLDLAQKVGGVALTKREVEPLPENKELEAWVFEKGKAAVYEVAKGNLPKNDRKARLDEIKTELEEKLLEEKGEEYMEENGELYSRYFGDLKKKVIRNMVLDEGVRLDGRKADEIRPIWCEVDYLPSAHGSAIFTRGETQSLTTLTLGTKQDEMLIDNALALYNEKFILHYNFPAFSVGETKPMRGPGRREVGHANLAGRSIRQVMPKDFPYTTRIVSDILESNGSSSMATVCAGCLALMDAGVPISSPVSGIAMGMIADGDKVAILSDILGDEDALGDMDFKVTGTENGITACQMDIKIDGLPYEKLEAALDQAKAGRLHILSKMKETIAAPNEDFKPHAPRIVEMIIDKSFIGAVIGPGGKVIQEIQAVTGAIINITEVDDQGIVNIASNDKASIEAAVNWVKKITFVPAVGDVYEAKVKTVMPYGVFVEFNGKSGLLHVSEISHSRIDNVEDVLAGRRFRKSKTYRNRPEKTGKIRLSRKALMPRPEGGGGGGRDNGRNDRNDRNRD
ncbi:MAG: polyribonucleotide nucleotidyltransferase [Saprospiraceae bacterium]